MGWQTAENKHLTDAGKGRSGDPPARVGPSLTDSQAVISYTQAPMKRESGRNEGECRGGIPSFQRNSGHDSRVAFTAARQIDDNVRRRPPRRDLDEPDTEPLRCASRTRPAPPSADVRRLKRHSAFRRRLARFPIRICHKLYSLILSSPTSICIHCCSRVWTTAVSPAARRSRR